MSLEIIFCEECRYWQDKYVKQNDGRLRQYRESDRDPIFNTMFVGNDIGINMGSRCLYDEQCIKDGYAIFRDQNDFCSQGRKRPCSYEQWYGIVDGFYPEKEDANE